MGSPRCWLGHKLQAGQTLQAPIEQREYLAYLDVVSPSNDALVSALTVEGEAPVNSGTFRAQVVDPGFAWARLGPYRVDVRDAAFDVGVSNGAIEFAGIELWYPE